VGQLPDQARLADPGLAHQRRHLAVAGFRPFERLVERFKLGLPPDEGSEPADRRRLQAGAGRPGADQFVHLDRLGDSLDRHRPEGPDLDIALSQPQRLRGEQGGPLSRDLLHTRGQMDGLAHRRVVHPEVVIDGPDDHLAGVEADPKLDRQPVPSAGLLGVTVDRLLHSEGAVAGPDGVVFVGDRRAEEGHDPIAEDVVDGPLVAVDRLHHGLDRAVEQGLRLLRVEALDQLGRALDVGEQDGDLLALAF